MKIIVAVTDWKAKYEIAPWMVKIIPDAENKLLKESSADCFQVRSVSQDRFISNIGKVSDSVSDDIKSGLARILSIR